MNKLIIKNGKILTPNRVIENGCILCVDGIIEYIGESEKEIEGCMIVDAKGQYVSPGFVDIHSHGGGGFDFMDGTVEAYLGVANIHAKHGTTSIVPTTLTSTNDELKKTFEIYEKASILNTNGAEFVGIHLEGPYFAETMKGAQDSKYLKKPKPEDYNQILAWTDKIVRWSAAPELAGSLEFARALKQRGILASIAHSEATHEEVEVAFESGFTHITHLYSCTSTIKRINGYRYAGIVESAYLIDDMTVEIIADGHHLPPSLLKLVYKFKGADKIALITDSMRAAGMDDGISVLGSIKNGQEVLVEGGVAKLMDGSGFAGSVATADILVKNMVKLANVPLLDAVKMATLTPARIIGIDHYKGCLAVGKQADIIIFDQDISIINTIINGKRIWEAV